MAEEEENHEWHCDNRKDSRNGDELRRFNIIAAIFGSEETK